MCPPADRVQAGLVAVRGYSLSVSSADMVRNSPDMTLPEFDDRDRHDLMAGQLTQDNSRSHGKKKGNPI